MDDYRNEMDMILFCKATLAMISFYSLRTMNVLIEMELEAEGLIPRLPLEPMFSTARRI
jgi:hypothetical protein